MTEKKLTHYRKAFNSPYLSSADIVDMTTLTIKNVKNEPNKTKKTKDNFNTAYFVEREIRKGEELKPMVLNVTNCEVLRNFTGSKYIDHWNDIKVDVYVVSGVRFGNEVVDGLRIKIHEQRARPVLTKGCKEWTRAVQAAMDGRLENVLANADIDAANLKLLKDEAGVD